MLGVPRIPIMEPVPADFRRAHIFYGPDGFVYSIKVNGEQWLEMEQKGEVKDAELSSRLLDWIALATTKIRMELGG